MGPITEWLEEILGVDEAAALARPVELLAQWEFSEEENWATYLHRLENSELESQWIRAWLVGPLQFPNFKMNVSSRKLFLLIIFDCLERHWFGSRLKELLPTRAYFLAIFP